MNEQTNNKFDYRHVGSAGLRTEKANGKPDMCMTINEKLYYLLHIEYLRQKAIYGLKVTTAAEVVHF